jgi:tetratricopeptide (TPR) repeat protein
VEKLKMDDSDKRRQSILICLGLALAVLAAYGRLWDCDFVAFDDGDYVTANEMVQRGVSWEGVVWAFSTSHASNWHPLTWISHMVDFQFYGLNAAGHHLTSLLLHLANSILLFLLLQRMTKAPWPSALAAALFALHPMHVESVAWISERKDVLSTLFWMLAVWAYVRYVEEWKLASPKSKVFYIGSVVLFALGLMAKPMLVTLPFILLLLDYWPLQRLRAPYARLLSEKIPFFILAAASCAAAFWAQRQGGAVISLAYLPLASRLENIPVSYLRYLGKTFWPAPLAVFYPMPGRWPVWEIAGAGAVLALVTAWVLWRARAQRYLATGWLWFLGMLAPVIGLLQIGSQSMADRYHYLPSVGLFILAIWAARECVPRFGARAPAVLGFLAVAGCMVATPLQVRYWKNSVTLFGHAAETTPSNPIIQNFLGNALYQEGRLDEALPHLLQAVAMAPGFAQAHYNLGNVLLARGRVAGALEQFQTQAALQPDDPFPQYNLGAVLLQIGRAGEAILHLQKALQIRPNSADCHGQLGNALLQAGRAAEAIGQYEKVLQIRPDDIQAASHLAWILATNPDASLRDGPKAVELALRANRLSDGKSLIIIGTLAAAYAEAGKFSEAVATVQRARQLALAQTNTVLADALDQQLRLYESGLPFRDTASPEQDRQK